MVSTTPIATAAVLATDLAVHQAAGRCDPPAQGLLPVGTTFAQQWQRQRDPRLAQRTGELEKTDVYPLRRIVPEERGKSW